jgi:hypothetical protein
VSPTGSALADLYHSGQLGELRFVLVGVMLAEEKLSSRRQLGADTSRSTAAVAPVRSRELGTGQSCIHGFSVLLLSTFSDVYGFRVVPRSLSGVSFLTTCKRLVTANFLE